MTDVETEVVWRGAEALRPFLVPVDALEPFPGNPRLGDVVAIRESLQRFGQVRAVLTDATGSRVVAGHHIRLAAAEEGWTHVAAIPNEFADEEEARAYLLADNRSHDLGPGYDTELLVAQLQDLAGADLLFGTGYRTEDIEAFLADLAEQERIFLDGPEGTPPRLDLIEGRQLSLSYTDVEYRQVEAWIGVVARGAETGNREATVYEALKIAASTFDE